MGFPSNMTYEYYTYFSKKRQAQIMLVADCNAIIDKLTKWENQGKENPVWQSMPTLTAGANREDCIFDDVPYAIGLSEYTASLLNDLVTNQPIESNGSKKCPINIAENDILPTLSITTQFGILEYFEVGQYKLALQKGKVFDIDTEKFFLKDISDRGLKAIIDGRVKTLSDSYSLKGVAKRVTSCWNAIGVKAMDDADKNLYVRLADRRNELTHEICCVPPTIDECKQYFLDCNYIAQKVNEHFVEAL